MRPVTIERAGVSIVTFRREARDNHDTGLL